MEILSLLCGTVLRFLLWPDAKVSEGQTSCDSWRLLKSRCHPDILAEVRASQAIDQGSKPDLSIGTEKKKKIKVNSKHLSGCFFLYCPEFKAYHQRTLHLCL